MSAVQTTRYRFKLNIVAAEIPFGIDISFAKPPLCPVSFDDCDSHRNSGLYNVSASEWAGGPILGWIGNRWSVRAALAVGAVSLTPALVLLGRAAAHQGREPELDEAGTSDGRGDRDMEVWRRGGRLGA